MKAVIFDLDLTLVDSSIAENARTERNWRLVNLLIPQFTLYNGFETVFKIIRDNHIKVGIVSTAPRQYVTKVVEYFNIPNNCIIGYHDAKPIKPAPEPMLKALELLKESANNVISFGDRAIDIQASIAAGIESVACFWGTKEKEGLLQSGFKYAIYEPAEIIDLIG